MKQLDKVIGKFMPRCESDLVPGAETWIGKVTTWQAAWFLEDGEYANEWAMVPAGPDRLTAPFGWVPSGDIELVDESDPCS